MSAVMRDPATKQLRCFRQFDVGDAEYVCLSASAMERQSSCVLGHLDEYDPWHPLRLLMGLDMSWCMYSVNGKPFMAGGFRFLTPTNVESMTVSTNEWRANVKNVTYDCRNVIDAMLKETSVRRIECRSLGENTPAHRWYEMLGFHKEATLEQYGPNSESVCIHAITKEKG